jgi:hypothetical protein
MEKTMSPKENGAPVFASQAAPITNFNAPQLTEKKPKIQAVIIGLKRDFAAEALAIAAIKASHAADDVLLGDDISAERGIRLAIAHLRAGAAAFRELHGEGSQ